MGINFFCLLVCKITQKSWTDFDDRLLFIWFCCALESSCKHYKSPIRISYIIEYLGIKMRKMCLFVLLHIHIQSHIESLLTIY